MESLEASFLQLVDIVKKLRDPNGGCPWDIEQTHTSLKPYLIEEAYEVIEAIDANSADLAKELGDVLLQVLLHSQIAAEAKTFTLKTVIDRLSQKLIDRHPHVFGDTTADTSKEVLQNWERIKQKELKPSESILDGVPAGMPALLRAQRTGEKAARVGFEWSTIDEIKAKVLEEIQEFLEASQTMNQARIIDEFGDILFALTQLSRRLSIDSENALHQATAKFSRRFKEMEQRSGKRISESTLEELDKIWEEVKADEKKSA